MNLSEAVLEIMENPRGVIYRPSRPLHAVRRATIGFPTAEEVATEVEMDPRSGRPVETPWPDRLGVSPGDQAETDWVAVTEATD